MQDSGISANKAQDLLWGALRSGQLRAGQFVSMTQLCDLFDCPIATTRDAVKTGAEQGLLITLPKRGVQVMDANADTIRESLDFRMVLDQEGARRRLASGETGGLDLLRARHEDMRDRVGTPESGELPPKAIAVDRSLHDFLAGGLGNSLMETAYAVNRIRIAIIQNVRPFLEDRILSAMEEHLAIIDALERRDEPATIDAIRHHYEQTLRWWGVIGMPA